MSNHNRERALDIVHALNNYLTVRFLAHQGTIANPEEAMDTGSELLVDEIEKALDEVTLDAVEP